MKLHALRVHNFGPYRGTQTLEFPSDPQRPVLVVFGENMRGKTSLMNALRWVLYGRALDRSAADIDLAKLVNSDASAEGDWDLRVTLEFEADGLDYELRRVARPRAGTSLPQSSRDFETSVYLKRDGAPLSGDDTKREIGRLLPEQISRFYLFDGELLQEYETLLRVDSATGERIKGAIEQILGVPALTNGLSDIRVLLREAQRMLVSENKHNSALADYAAQFERTEEQLRRHEADLDELTRQRADHAARLQEIDGVLANTEATRRWQGEIDALERETKVLTEQEQRLRADRTDAFGGAWKDLLQPRLNRLRSDLTSGIEDARRQIEAIGALRSESSSLQELLDTRTCTVCGSDIAEDRRVEVGARLGDLNAKLAQHDRSSQDMSGLSARLSTLHRVQGNGSMALVERSDRDLAQTVHRLQQIQGEIETRRDRLRGHDMAEIARLQRERDGTNNLIGKVGGEIERASRVVEEKRALKRDLTNKLRETPGVRGQRAERIVRSYEGLEKTFERGVGRLRDRLRVRVGEAATEAFLELTTEPTYRGLQIDRGYGLTIIDRSGREVTSRAASAEQIVALSLLSALNRTADRPGPVIIDTPFGRLDPGHRENILRYLPQMADQVVLFVHGGEIDREQGLDVVGERLGSVYEIESRSSSHSELRRWT